MRLISSFISTTRTAKEEQFQEMKLEVDWFLYEQEDKSGSISPKINCVSAGKKIIGI